MIIAIEVTKITSGGYFACARYKGSPIYGIADTESEAVELCKDNFVKKYGETDFRRFTWQVGNEQGIQFLEKI